MAQKKNIALSCVVVDVELPTWGSEKCLARFITCSSVVRTSMRYTDDSGWIFGLDTAVSLINN